MKLTALAASLQAARLRRPTMHWRVLHVPIWMHAPKDFSEWVVEYEWLPPGLAEEIDRLAWARAMKG